MQTVDIRGLYDEDPRPTFVVDCDDQPAGIYHVNSALLDLPHLALSLHAHNALRDWWDPSSRVASRHQQEFRHGRYRWAKFTACQRWLIITLIEQPPQTEEPKGHLQQSSQLARVASPLHPHAETIFTVKIQSPELREHIERLQKVDWGRTSLGPIAGWSYELNLLVTTLMLETRPTAIFLGFDHIIVYNLAYGAVSGSRHPAILGQSILDAWPEVADPVSTTMERSQQTRFADTPEKEYHFMIERNGFVEESFFMWSLISLVGVGQINGMYSIVTEVTKQRLLERRVNALLRFGQLSSEAVDAKAFWKSIREAIYPSEYDFPAAVLYSHCEVETTGSAVTYSKTTSRNCSLEWTIGYRVNHPDIPQKLDLEQDLPLGRAIAGSAKKGVATLYRHEDGRLPSTLFTDVEKRGFGDPCKAMLIIPVRTSNETITGYIIVGLNTRRPYDTEYQDWIEVFSNLLGTSAASVALHEEEVRNRKRQEEEAARDREALSAEVAVLAQEASDVTEKLSNFYQLANAVGLGYFEFAISGELVHANEAFFHQTGHPRDLSNSRPFAFLEHVYGPDRELATEHWRMSASGKSTTYEMRWKKKPNADTGSEDDTRDYLWTLTACVPIKTEDGIVTGIFGCNTDISGQKEATRIALLRVEAERRLASFTQTAPVGFYQCDSDLKIQYCNDQWFNIVGHPITDISAIDWTSRIYQDDLEAVTIDSHIVMQVNKLHTFSFRVKKLWTGPDDLSTPTWVLATATAHRDKDGQVVSVMGTLTDVSQLKWAEAIQRSRVEEALESKRQQENFIDMTSHEMRNPLSAMVQCADSISSALAEMEAAINDNALTTQPSLQTKIKDLVGTSIDAIDTIQACATHQKRIVDDILTLSKLDSKLLVISPITVQPDALLQDSYKMFKEEANKARVSLRVHSDASLKDLQIDYAILDPSRVLQVLINLLTNAIKFTRTQPVRKVGVIMSATREPAGRSGIEYVPQKALSQDFLDEQEWGSGEVFYLHFTVTDTGCGLTTEQKNKLFLRFSQASPKTHVQYGGSGLGLFISRELTEMQGGGIGVQSTQGVGSIFSFYVKSRSAAPGRRNSTTFNLPSRAKSHIIQDKQPMLLETATPPLPSPKYHILVVEDNLINQRVLCNQLKKIGCTVQVANHGREALSELAKTKYWKQPAISEPHDLSVVLMDVEMPVMDGMTCARKIRSLQESGDITGHVPIIAVSANARREQIEQAKGAGMDDAISKPFRIPELLNVIDTLLSGNAGGGNVRRG
ncbi:hypothetical protein HBI88_052490 [Parastagonospora nodorum]|nr:hypothetical protein HBH74_090550 [Parastagonospora nodorum]KAH4946514.1 hypothetical protein HBH73_137710 [Parastagonospora nodorum]KAH5775360.1 hypothetical protein HBI97_136530 [Parastagonospora nodorum]KAH5800228.1 hypothetical protein HBI94_220140 [Parastagonospora nodorum]KAH5803290.1 hypothetical protein HBI96_130140 [Parastagonospora nodorum]